MFLKFEFPKSISRASAKIFSNFKFNNLDFEFIIFKPSSFLEFLIVTFSNSKSVSIKFTPPYKILVQKD